MFSQDFKEAFNYFSNTLLQFVSKEVLKDSGNSFKKESDMIISKVSNLNSIIGTEDSLTQLTFETFNSKKKLIIGCEKLVKDLEQLSKIIN